MKAGKAEKMDYMKEKQKHHKLCGRKAKEEREKEQQKIEQIKNGTDIWKYIKKERGRRVKSKESINEQL